MKKITLGLVSLIIFSLSAKAQLDINPGVDTTSLINKKVIAFYSNYISAFKGKKQLPDYKEYWGEDDCKKYKNPDPSVYGIGGDYPTYLMAERKTIHYLKPLKDGIFNIKMLGSWTDSTKNNSIMYITNQFIKVEPNNKMYFIQPIAVYKNSWSVRSFGPITYHFPKYHKFDEKKAQNLVTQIKDLEQKWELSPKKITYFFADTYDEIQLIRGFDFTIGMGNADKPMGISNQDDNLVFCAGKGEDYFHEVVHIYLNPLHPKSPLNEGLAVFYGGTLGKPLSWHTARLNNYLKTHPEIDLSKLDDFYYMDNYTNPGSAIQGIICNAIFKRDGMKGLKRLMTYTSMNEVFEKEFKMNMKDLNQELRKLIDQQ
ncbi:hypothetical protein [Nubsella zeaxanthinifaciens]|uniref:hypothetical protein n=1 Tax=Nubsella zeaxanthinifaciens TaxID=392412 RepID=UPI000DE4C8D3|nr:hypothetical protein [Nubsella zeaxanthinifaciens]